MRRIGYIIGILLFFVSCEEKGKQFTVNSSQNKIWYCGDTLQFEIG